MHLQSSVCLKRTRLYEVWPEIVKRQKWFMLVSMATGEGGVKSPLHHTAFLIPLRELVCLLSTFVVLEQRIIQLRLLTHRFGQSLLESILGVAPSFRLYKRWSSCLKNESSIEKFNHCSLSHPCIPGNSLHNMGMLVGLSTFESYKNCQKQLPMTSLL